MNYFWLLSSAYCEQLAPEFSTPFVTRCFNSTLPLIPQKSCVDLVERRRGKVAARVLE